MKRLVDALAFAAVSGLTIEGTGNFRDLGGLPAGEGRVRPGALMRSDALTDITDRGRRRLAALGVRTIVDIREPIERARHPNAIDGLPVTVQELPLFDGLVEMGSPRGLEVLYREVLDACGTRFARIASALCVPDALPAVVHCSAGKDRTGLVCAVVLDAIGVDREAIIEDYVRTEQSLRGDAFDRAMRRAIDSGMREQELMQNMGAPPEVMERALDHLDRVHGGAVAYLRRHGLADVDALRAALLETA
jgi:protein-tyrosine phosphatase